MGQKWDKFCQNINIFEKNLTKPIKYTILLDILPLISIKKYENKKNLLSYFQKIIQKNIIFNQNLPSRIGTYIHLYNY